MEEEEVAKKVDDVVEEDVTETDAVEVRQTLAAEHHQTSHGHAPFPDSKIKYKLITIFPGENMAFVDIVTYDN